MAKYKMVIENNPEEVEAILDILENSGGVVWESGECFGQFKRTVHSVVLLKETERGYVYVCPIPEWPTNYIMAKHILKEFGSTLLRMCQEMHMTQIPISDNKGRYCEAEFVEL